jgi:hypothetical protein
VTLAYLRRNRVQHELAEFFGMSQPTVSRAVTTIAPLIGAAIEEWIPVADEIDPVPASSDPSQRSPASISAVTSVPGKHLR